MRCFNECTATETQGCKIYPIPNSAEDIDCIDSNIPMCPECLGKMWPNVLWFDECYNEKYYRSD